MVGIQFRLFNAFKTECTFQDKTALKRMSYLWDKYIHVSYARGLRNLRNITSLAQSLFFKIHFNFHVAEELFESGCTRLIHVFMKMNSSIMLLVSVTCMTDQIDSYTLCMSMYFRSIMTEGQHECVCTLWQGNTGNRKGNNKKSTHRPVKIGDRG